MSKGSRKTLPAKSKDAGGVSVKTTQPSASKKQVPSTQNNVHTQLTQPQDAVAIAASLGIPILDSSGLKRKDLPDNLKAVIKDLMEISTGIVSENKSTKMAAVQAMKKKFSELGLFSWLDISDDGTMRKKRQLKDNHTSNQQIHPDQLPGTIQAILRDASDWYADDCCDHDIHEDCECDDYYTEDGEDEDSDLEYLFDTENDLNHIDPVKLQVVQSAESELSSVYAMFESKDVKDDEKLSVLKRKYMELMQQDIRHRLDNLRVKETVQAVEVDRDVARRELDKMNKLKARLESLCCELQAENRRLKSEAVKRLTTGSNTSNNQQKCKFKNGCSRCGCTLDLNTAFPVLPDLPDPTVLQKIGSRTLAEQLTKFVDIYRLRERHFTALLREKEVEADVHLARTLQAELTNDDYLDKIGALEKHIAALTRAESELKGQLAIYVEKFKQVEETLGKSNDLFATFRREMEQMTAKLSRLESENHALQTKCGTLSRNIIEMADERTRQNATVDTLKTQKAKLEQLCRTLQAERKASAAVLNGALPGSVCSPTT